jgi:pantoate kinase
LDTFLTRLGETGDFKIVAEHQIPLPIGAGFGTSGAAALSLAIALDEVFGLGMSEIEAAQLAHMAEVECKTGLGTVIAEFFGGLEIRVKPGAPGIGEIEQVPVPGDHKVVCLSFNSLSTREFLSDEKTRRYINELGGNLVDKFIESPDVRNFMRFSRQFAEQIGLITAKVREVLDAVDQAGFACSMPMFGESVFALIENGSLPEILKIFRRCNNGGRIFVSGIDFEGARLLK